MHSQTDCKTQSACCVSSFIRTVTVGFGFTPNLPLEARGLALRLTTGGDLHPALKMAANIPVLAEDLKPCEENAGVNGFRRQPHLSHKCNTSI